MLAALVMVAAGAMGTAQGQGQAQAQAAAKANDPVQTLVSRLELERYKATVKGLTQFGDRRQGTERNRKAVDWIEAQLKSYGCATERISPSTTRLRRTAVAEAAVAVVARGRRSRRVPRLRAGNIVPGRGARDCAASPAEPASTTIPRRSPTSSFAS